MSSILQLNPVAKCIKGGAGFPLFLLRRNARVGRSSPNFTTVKH